MEKKARRGREGLLKNILDMTAKEGGYCLHNSAFACAREVWYRFRVFPLLMISGRHGEYCAPVPNHLILCSTPSAALCCPLASSLVCCCGRQRMLLTNRFHVLCDRQSGFSSRQWRFSVQRSTFNTEHLTLTRRTRAGTHCDYLGGCATCSTVSYLVQSGRSVHAPTQRMN